MSENPEVQPAAKIDHTQSQWVRWVIGIMAAGMLAMAGWTSAALRDIPSENDIMEVKTAIKSIVRDRAASWLKLEIRMTELQVNQSHIRENLKKVLSKLTYLRDRLRKGGYCSTRNKIAVEMRAME